MPKTFISDADRDSLKDLINSEINTPSDNQILSYDGVSRKWRNSSLPGETAPNFPIMSQWPMTPGTSPPNIATIIAKFEEIRDELGATGVISHLDGFTSFMDSNYQTFYGAFAASKAFFQISNNQLTGMSQAAYLAALDTLLTTYGKILWGINLCIEINPTQLVEYAGTIRLAQQMVKAAFPRINTSLSFQLDAAAAAGTVSVCSDAIAALVDQIGVTYYPSEVGTYIADITIARFSPIIQSAAKFGKHVIVTEFGYDSLDRGQAEQSLALQKLWDLMVASRICPLLAYSMSNDQDWLPTNPSVWNGIGLKDASNVKKLAWTTWDNLRKLAAGASSADILSERATQVIAAGTTISVTDGVPVTPYTTSGNVTSTAAPFIAAGRNGQLVILRNDNGTGTLTLSDTNIGAGGSLLRLSANTVTMAAGSTMGLEYSSTLGAWVQVWYLALVAVIPAINTHTVNIGAGASNAQNAEVASGGTSVPTFAWTFTGVPSAGSVDVSSGGDPGTDYPATISAPFTSLTGPAYNKGTSVGTVRTFTPSITVNGVVKTIPTATVTYYNRRYAGMNSQAAALDSAQTVALGSFALDNAYNTGSGNLTMSAGAKYAWYCFRSALGISNLYFSLAGEIAGFSRIGTGTVSVTNGSGFAETFEQFRSDITFDNLGTVSLALSSSLPNNRIYMGPGPVTDPITNANILALDDTADGESIVSSSLARTYTAIKIEAGEYLWFCHPSRISDLATIKDGTTGFAIAGSYRTNVSHTNQYGYVETYRCWRSDNAAIFPSGENVVVS